MYATQHGQCIENPFLDKDIIRKLEILLSHSITVLTYVLLIFEFNIDLFMDMRYMYITQYMRYAIQ